MTLREEILQLAEKHKSLKNAGNPTLRHERHKNIRRQERFGKCERKKQYTLAMANYAARSIRMHTSGRAKPYHCKNCGFWHVGSF